MATTLFATTYARLSGVLLVLTGVVGIVALGSGYLGFTFGNVNDTANAFLLWDQTHNVLHLFLGAIALYVGFSAAPKISPILYGKAFGVVYTLLGIVGLASPNVLGLGSSLGGLHLELGENLIHLFLGGLGLVAGFYVVEGDEPATETVVETEAVSGWAPSRSESEPATQPGFSDWRGPAPEAILAGLSAAERKQAIEATEGIAETYGTKLRSEGVTTLEEFLRRSPDDLAVATGINQTLVRKWHDQGQLQAINGVGPQFSELLVRAGVVNMEQLAKQKPAALAKKLAEYQDSLEVRVEGRKVTNELTGDWIKQAKVFVKEIASETGSETSTFNELPEGSPSGA